MNIYKAIDAQTQVKGRETQHFKSIGSNVKKAVQNTGEFLDVFDGASSYRETAKSYVGEIPILSWLAQGAAGIIGFIVKDLIVDGFSFVFGVPKDLVVDPVIHIVGAGIDLVSGDEKKPRPQKTAQLTPPALPKPMLQRPESPRNAKNTAEFKAQIERSQLQARLVP